MTELDAILRRPLVLVAHPDDETVAFGALLTRMHEPAVAFATDGAPLAEFFWKRWGSREEYARVRQTEARKALTVAGVASMHFGHVPDQQLHVELDSAWPWLRNIAEEHRPAAVLTLAYEGGHPDHDTCAVLGMALGVVLDIPVWEAPLYHRRDGAFTTQEFLETLGNEIRFELSSDDVRGKRDMADAYASQVETVAQFRLGSEIVRPQAKYDFRLPPHSGAVNYQAWQWPVSPPELSAEYVRFLAGVSKGEAK